MIVTRANFDQALKIISASPLQRALDTETKGIWWWDTPHVPWYSPSVFSLQISTLDKHDFYFDFLHMQDRLSDEHWQILQKEIFANPDAYWFIQNAKFDMHQMANHGVDILGTVHCTKSIARVVNNREESLKLEDLGQKYFQTGKEDVKTYVMENGLFTKVYKMGDQEKGEDWVHYDRVPLDIMVPYGIKDTRLCLDLGMLQLQKVKELEFATKATVSKVVANENELIKTCFKMEREGVKIDSDYCNAALTHEKEKYREQESILTSEFVNAQILAAIKETNKEDKINWNSAHHIKTFFKTLGIESFKITEKGAMSFDRDALESMDHPAAKAILKYRYHYKRAHTYFENFLWLADQDSVLHCDFQPPGADTGRVSCWNPNLQNVPKRRDKDESDYKVRRCFVARPGKLFVEMDYQAAEYRMMLDYAREMALIEKIKAGWDVHDATREELGFESRDVAKTINFGLLYGMGIAKFAVALKCKQWEAKKKKAHYFDKLPGVRNFIFTVRSAAQQRGYIFNWLGRVLFYDTRGYPDGDTFKSPNGLIQGGVGDCGKVAMNEAAKILARHKSKLLIQVHDSLLFEIDRTETHLIESLKQAMRDVYPHKVLPMDVDVGFSENSWADLTDELPAIS